MAASGHSSCSETEPRTRGAAENLDERFGDPGGSDPGEATSSAASASFMRERAAQSLNPEMGRMGAEDPSTAFSAAPLGPVYIQAMNEAVIVALGRSPIGRARKGSLVDVRPDDLASHVVTKVLEKVPELDRSEIEDLICGCGLPGGEQGHNIGRVVSILSRLDVPGVTVNRYCSSSLMTTRIATHAIEAGEGDVFLSVGVECVSRYGSGYPDAPDTYNPRLVPGNTDEYPDIYIAMGQTAENVARREKISREEQDRFAVKSQNAAVAAQGNGFFDREVIPVPLPNGEMFTKDDGPRPGTTIEVLGTLKQIGRASWR